MEQKSKKSAEEVKMTPKANEKKPTYEQLEEYAKNLNQQCKQMYEKLQEADRIIGSFNEVGFLLEIIGKAEYFDDAFIGRCCNKIQSTVTAMLDSVESQEETEKKN